MATKIDDLAIVLSASTDQLAGDLRAAAKLLDGFKKAVDKSGADSPGAKAAAKDLREQKRAAKDTGGALQTAGDTGASSFFKMTGVLFAAGVALDAVRFAGQGVGEVFNQVKDSVKMAAEVEQTTLAFDVMLGSAERAKDMVAGLRKFAAETPFNSREVSAAGKQLLAYGIAADQVIPTLRMLGDVSAAFGQDLALKDLVYLYGTLFAQQRAYAVDIRQFAGRGIPIYEELAKVVGKNVDEVKNLVEEGHIGRDQVTAAFVSMTGAGGRFFQMTARQSKTLLGSWEQMVDAFDLAKVKLGQIVIEEADLKGVARDLESFAKRLEAGADTNGLRQGIRFAADLARGVAQVGYEFARAGVQSADIFGRMANDVPQFRDTLQSIQAVVNGMKEFKLDPSAVADVAVSVSKDILATAGALIITGSAVAKAFKEDILDPLVDAIKWMRKLVGDVRGVAPALNETLKVTRIMTGGGVEAGDIGDFGDFLTRRLDDLNPLKTPQQRAMDHIMQRGQGFLGAGGTGTGGAGGPAVPPPAKDAFDAMKDFGQKLKDLTATLDRAGADVKYHLEAQKRDKAAEALGQQRLAEAAAYRAQWENFSRLAAAHARGGLGRLGMSPVDLMASLPSAAFGLNREKAAVSGLSFALQMATGGTAAGQMLTGDYKDGVRLQGDLRPGAIESAKQLKDRYDPFAAGGKLDEHRRDLDDALRAGKITPDLHALGMRDAIKEVADRLGVGGPTQLPEAAMQGSAESVRILNQWQSGQMRAEDFLSQLVELAKLQLQAQKDAAQRMVLPEVAPLPK